MADIAAVAGVHKTTVSLALRGHRSIPPKTRARILSHAEDLGYRPDPALRALSDYRRGKVSAGVRETTAYLVFGDDERAWRADAAQLAVFAGAEARAEELGFRLTPFWCSRAQMSHARLQGILRSQGIQSVIVAGASEELQIDWSDFCGIEIGPSPFRTPLTRVMHDCSTALQRCVSEIVQRGYRSVGLVVDGRQDPTSPEAWSHAIVGALDLACALTQSVANLVLPLVLSETGDDADLRAAARLQSWYLSQRPEVILGATDVVWRWLETTNLPHQGRPGYAQLKLTDGTTTCAGVLPDYAGVGRMAVENLAGRLQQNQFGLPQPATTTLVEGTWHNGETLRPKQSA
jgi:LacI family transcriptional regulator